MITQSPADPSLAIEEDRAMEEVLVWVIRWVLMGVNVESDEKRRVELASNGAEVEVRVRLL